jgi:hypothetical protein
MRGVFVVAVCMALVGTLSACAPSPSHYDTYKDYLHDADLKHVDALPKADVSQLADDLCAHNLSMVKQAVQLLTAPLPNGYDMTGIGIAQAGYISKAFCDDRAKSFFYLAQAVSDTFGPSMVATIPS